MAQQIITNGESGLAVRGALNSMFTELYASITEPIKQPGNTANVQIPIPANTKVQEVSLSGTSGSPTVRVGVTPNGIEISDDTLLGNSELVSAQYYFENAGILYFTLSGTGTYSIRVDVQYNYY